MNKSSDLLARRGYQLFLAVFSLVILYIVIYLLLAGIMNSIAWDVVIHMLLNMFILFAGGVLFGVIQKNLIKPMQTLRKKIPGLVLAFILLAVGITAYSSWSATRPAMSAFLEFFILYPLSLTSLVSGWMLVYLFPTFLTKFRENNC